MANVCPSVKLLYTKTKKDNCKRFFWKVFTENRNSQDFNSIARRLTKLKPNEIFNNVAIYQDPIDVIDLVLFYISKVWTRKLHQTRLDPIARRFPKMEPNESLFHHILVFEKKWLNKYLSVWKLLTRNQNCETDRTTIAEVTV